MSAELVGAVLASVTIAGLLGWVTGRYSANRLHRMSADAMLRTIASLREDVRSYREDGITLRDEFIRVSRASAGLPEIGPPAPKVEEEVVPPARLVSFCSLYDTSGPEMLRSAISQYRSGIPWQMIQSGLENHMENQSPELLNTWRMEFKEQQESRSRIMQQ